jgi:hypothetical protein
MKPVKRGVLHALGHGRPCQLLKAQRKLRLQATFHTQQQECLKEVQQLVIQLRRLAPGLVDGPGHIARVCFGNVAATRHVGPVHGEAGRDLQECLVELFARVVAVPTVPFADRNEQRGQSLQFAA